MHIVLPKSKLHLFCCEQLSVSAGIAEFVDLLSICRTLNIIRIYISVDVIYYMYSILKSGTRSFWGRCMSEIWRPTFYRFFLYLFTIAQKCHFLLNKTMNLKFCISKMMIMICFSETCSPLIVLLIDQPRLLQEVFLHICSEKIIKWLTSNHDFVF